ncbi:MAG TPA: redoxin domain-containing protein [Candidatus Eremiobacteraceae bacterium]|nr:redoxin domain-containing protein [Candidatus Eremiobacteraceae bacterium]
MLSVGHKLTDFECDAYHDGQVKKIRLSSFEGKWLVLLFYPGDFTFICPTELGDAAQHYDQFITLGAEVFSVSTDSAFVHKAWHDQSPAVKNVRYPMIADSSGKLSRHFGTFIEESGTCVRATFIIDPDGVARASEFHDQRIGRNIDEILRKLQAAVFVRGHDDEVCLANWRPGAKTLKPSIDLVGKI